MIIIIIIITLDEYTPHQYWSANFIYPYRHSTMLNPIWYTGMVLPYY